MTANLPLWKPLTPGDVQLLHIDYAAMMVDQLVPCTEDANLPAVVQNACLESFFVNVRLLAEFLQGWGSERKDFWAMTLLPSWVPADSDLAKRLQTWWVLASQHVVHFGKPRLANHAEDDLDVTRDAGQDARRRARGVQALPHGVSGLAAGRQFGQASRHRAAW